MLALYFTKEVVGASPKDTSTSSHYFESHCRRRSTAVPKQACP